MRMQMQTHKKVSAHKQREIWLERANVYAVCHLHFHTERERVGVVCTYNLHHSSCVSATHNYRKWTFGWQNKWFYLSGHKFKIIEVCAFDAGFVSLKILYTQTRIETTDDKSNRMYAKFFLIQFLLFHTLSLFLSKFDTFILFYIKRQLTQSCT